MATVPSNSTRSCSSFSLLTDGPKAPFDSVFSSTLCSSYRLFSEDFPRPDSGSWTVSCRPRCCGNDQYATCATHAWFSSSLPFPGCTWGRGSSRHNAFVSLPVGNNCIRIQCSIELRRGMPIFLFLFCFVTKYKNNNYKLEKTESVKIDFPSL